MLVTAAASFTTGVRADIPQGLPTAPHWSFLHTAGIFAGIPLAASIVIIALVMLQSQLKGARATGGTVVFSGPHAGDVDAGAVAGGSGPVTETGEDSGMHREVAQPSQDRGGDSPVADDDANAGLAADHADARSGTHAERGAGGGGTRW